MRQTNHEKTERQCLTEIRGSQTEKRLFFKNDLKQNRKHRQLVCHGDKQQNRHDKRKKLPTTLLAPKRLLNLSIKKLKNHLKQRLTTTRDQRHF